MRTDPVYGTRTSPGKTTFPDAHLQGELFNEAIEICQERRNDERLEQSFVAHGFFFRSPSGITAKSASRGVWLSSNL
jgi:hypothetical protein